jgi:hypothetical protein
MAESGVEPLPDANANADDPEFTSISRRNFEIITDNRERMQAWSGERGGKVTEASRTSWSSSGQLFIMIDAQYNRNFVDANDRTPERFVPSLPRFEANSWAEDFHRKSYAGCREGQLIRASQNLFIIIRELYAFIYTHVSSPSAIAVWPHQPHTDRSPPDGKKNQLRIHRISRPYPPTLIRFYIRQAWIARCFDPPSRPYFSHPPAGASTPDTQIRI